jgi:hypothetical protein
MSERKVFAELTSPVVRLTARNTKLVNLKEQKRVHERMLTGAAADADSAQRRRALMRERCPTTAAALDAIEAEVWGPERRPGSPYEHGLLIDLIGVAGALDAGMELSAEAADGIAERVRKNKAWREDPKRNLWPRR